MALDRIGNAAAANFMLAQIQKTEAALDASNRQVVTGKLADTYGGYGDKTAAMEAARPAGFPPPPQIPRPQPTTAPLALPNPPISPLPHPPRHVPHTPPPH